MIDFTIETDIARPPRAVFAYVTDPAKLLTWQTNTLSSELQTDPPVRAGSRLREVHIGPGGRHLDSLVEVVEYEPERAFALHMIEAPLPLDAAIAFEPRDGGTHMRFRVHGRLRGAMRLAQPVLGRMLRRQFAAQCQTLKRVLEQDGGAQR